MAVLRAPAPAVLLLLLLAQSLTVDRAAGTVDVIMVRNMKHDKFGVVTTKFRVDIRVENLVVSKSVMVNFEELPKVTPWAKTPATYIRKIGTSTSVGAGNYELWRWETESSTMKEFRFIVECDYAPSSVVYGRDVAGSDFIIPHGSGERLPHDDVAVMAVDFEASKSEGLIKAGVLLRHLGPVDKIVKLYYTDSDFTTNTYSYALSYNFAKVRDDSLVVYPNVHGTEYWSFTATEFSTTASELKYYIVYTTGGKDYYDNNGGANYVYTL
eukprot:TRINITY_DN15902_c0_g1_i1.p1 TRINITY_DN15902_c0_g1~~TRINITY_DN15902_c0_g1_i1.p1  ORF type:complete len:269 (+),score=61.37 TRINITY_DN15902_c0_g1_i1:49-855(+)